MAAFDSSDLFVKKRNTCGHFLRTFLLVSSILISTIALVISILTIRKLEIVSNNKNLVSEGCFTPSPRRECITIDSIQTEIKLQQLESEINKLKKGQNYPNLRNNLNDSSEFLRLPWPYNGYTYFTTDTMNTTWKGTRSICQKYGADLAVHGIQNKAIRLSVTSALGLGNQRLWIGLKKVNRERYWTWSNGDRVQENEIDWIDGRSNAENQDCGELFTMNHEIKINSEQCNRRRKGLCEKRYRS